VTDEGKLILQGDLKFPNSVVKDQQDAVHNLDGHLAVGCLRARWGASKRILVCAVARLYTRGEFGCARAQCVWARANVCVCVCGQVLGSPGGV